MIAARYAAPTRWSSLARALRDAGELEATHHRGELEAVATDDRVDRRSGSGRARGALPSRTAPSPRAGAVRGDGSCSTGSSHRARRRAGSGRSARRRPGAVQGLAEPLALPRGHQGGLRLDQVLPQRDSRSGRAGSAKAPWKRAISVDREVELAAGPLPEGGLRATSSRPPSRPPSGRGAAAAGPRAAPAARPPPGARREAASACTRASVTGVSPILTKARLRPRASKTCSTGLRLARAVPSPRLKSTGSPKTSSR